MWAQYHLPHSGLNSLWQSDFFYSLQVHCEDSSFPNYSQFSFIMNTKTIDVAGEDIYLKT